MSNIDERVVSMKFLNSGFLNGIKSTLSGLADLKKGMNLDGAAKSMDELGKAGRNFSMDGLSSAVQGVSGKFIALATIGITALTRITNQAITTGQQMVKSLTVAPIMDGFREYELKMGSIQTILANTSRHGTTLEEVTANLDELNKYADKTIYNFGDMTRNIGLFTNAGIKVDDATSMIKGFSNEAAASGTNAQGAAGAAYQLSQALSTGTIRLMDWRSLTNVGMGNKNMQNGIIEIADAMGAFEGSTITAADAAKDFNGSLEKNWLSADVMQKYLQIQAGDLSKEQMRSIGLTNEQIDAFLKQQQIAEDAATKVRTYTQLMDTLKEGVGSSWAETWDLLIGDFNEATNLWTNVSETLGDLIGKMGAARNAKLTEFVDLGGRDVAIEAVTNAFQALLAIMKPIKSAFRQIFPPATGETLFRITTAIRDFTENLKIGGSTANKIMRIFRGLFSVLDIGWMVIKGLFGVFADLVGAATEGSGGFLSFAASIGDWLTRLRTAIKEGKGLTDFFSGLGRLLAVPIGLLQLLGEWLGKVFGNKLKTDGIDDASKKVQQRLKPILKLGEHIRDAWNKMHKLFGRLQDALRPLTEGVVGFFTSMSDAIKNSVGDMDFSTLLDTISVGLLGGLVLLIRNFLKNGFSFGKEDVGGGFLDSIKETLGGVTDTLGAMQANLKAGTLMKIAGAIALLGGAVIVLSLIDPGRLTSAMVAVTAMIGQLVAGMALLDAASSGMGFIRLPFIAAGLVILAGALLILSAAVTAMSRLSWEEIGKGLAAVTAMIVALSIAVKVMSGSSGAMVRAGAALMLVAIAVRLLATSVSYFAGMEWDELARGFAAVGAALTALALFTRLAKTGKGAFAASAGLILLGVALNVIAVAVKKFAGMNWEELGRGFASMAASLGLIVLAMRLLPKDMVAKSVGLTVVAGALMVLAQALQMMGGMSWGEFAVSMAALGGSLLILAAAMGLMMKTMAGAKAMLVMVAALALLAPILLTFSQLSWEEVITGLTMLGGAFAVIGLAGLALTPILPALALLAGVILLMGVGTLAAGAGLLAFSVGLTALGVAAGASAAGLAAAVAVIIGLIPAAAAALAQGLLTFVTTIAASAPQFLVAMTTLLMTLIRAIDAIAPQIIKTLVKLITMLLNAIEKMVPRFVEVATTVIMSLLNAITVLGPRIIATLTTLIISLVEAIVILVPRFVDAGMRIIVGVLEGIANNIDDIVTAGADIIVSFLQGIQENYPRIVDEGMQTIVTFVQGLADGIRNNQAAMNAAGRDLAGAIADGLTGGLASKVGSAASAAADWASGALQGAKDALGINSPSKEFEKIGVWVNQGFIKGLKKDRASVQTTYDQMNDMLKELTRKSQTEIDKQRAKIKQLTDSRDEDTRSIKAAQKALEKARKGKDGKVDKKAVATQTERIRKLTKARKADIEGINAAQKALAKANRENLLARTARNNMNRYYKDEREQLKTLAGRHEKVNKQLEEANQNLADAKKTRDDFRASTTSSYSKLEDITKDTKLPEYVENLKKQVQDTIDYAGKLQKLRSLGLNDKLYNEFLSQGIEANPFVDQLIAGGMPAVGEINNLTNQLDSAAGNLGSTAAKELYQAGVDAAAGLVRGLQQQEKAIAAQMDKIAKKMANAIKKSLKIKSPSRVFMEVGDFTAKGLVAGLQNATGSVEKASANMGNSAFAALQDTMSNLSSVVAADMDLSPTIRPVLDLSEVRNGAGQINGMLAPGGISSAGSYAKAATIAAENKAAQQAMAEAFSSEEAGRAPVVVNFEQNNNSPKPLNTAEIYRQTNNQLSKLKEGLPV